MRIFFTYKARSLAMAASWSLLKMASDDDDNGGDDNDDDDDDNDESCLLSVIEVTADVITASAVEGDVIICEVGDVGEVVVASAVGKTISDGCKIKAHKHSNAKLPSRILSATTTTTTRIHRGITRFGLEDLEVGGFRSVIVRQGNADQTSRLRVVEMGYNGAK